MYILARAPGGQMRGAATQAMPLSIVEERQRSRCPPAAAPLRAAVRRHAGSLLAPYIPGVCSSLAPCQRAWGPQQNAHVIHAQTLRRRK